MIRLMVSFQWKVNPMAKSLRDADAAVTSNIAGELDGQWTAISANGRRPHNGVPSAAIQLGLHGMDPEGSGMYESDRERAGDRETRHTGINLVRVGGVEC
jgi:hypothetical protein